MAPRKAKAPVAEELNQNRDVDGAKRAVLDKAVGDILKRYGEGSIMRLGQAHGMVTESFPTGSLSLDIALGVGGIPRGRITEIYGPESSGKTTLCQHIVAEAQKHGRHGRLTSTWNTPSIPPTPPRAAWTSTTCSSRSPIPANRRSRSPRPWSAPAAVDVVVIDSVAALVPRSEIEGDMGDATMGVQARLMSQALRKLSGAINQTKTTVIFTNQLRQKIGVMFGNPETTTGGQALKFYASVRLDVRRIQSIKVGDEVIGNRTRVKVVKNKVAPPFRTAEFDIMYNEGISKSGDVLDLATQFEVVQKRGAFFSYGDIRIGQGRENAKDFLRQNPDLMAEIEAVIRQKALSGEIALPLDIGGGDDGGSAAEEE